MSRPASEHSDDGSGQSSPVVTELIMPIQRTWQDTLENYLYLLLYLAGCATLFPYLLLTFDFRQDRYSTGLLIAQFFCLALAGFGCLTTLQLVVCRVWRRYAEACRLTADELVWNLGYASALIPLVSIVRVEPRRCRFYPHLFVAREGVLLTFIGPVKWQVSPRLIKALAFASVELPATRSLPGFGFTAFLLPLHIEPLIAEIAARSPQLIRTGDLLTSPEASKPRSG